MKASCCSNRCIGEWERGFDLGSPLALLFPKQSGGALSARSLGKDMPYITYQPRFAWLREEVEAFKRIFIQSFSLGGCWIISSNCGLKKCLERWDEEGTGDQRTERCNSHILCQGQNAMRKLRTTLNGSAFYLKINIHHLGCCSPTYVISIPRRGCGTTLSKKYYAVSEGLPQLSQGTLKFSSSTQVQK